ncbi:MAG: hypothetical protein Q9169_008480, partial [Polycauliona sp. 2 TL-2023]
YHGLSTPALEANKNPLTYHREIVGQANSLVPSIPLPLQDRDININASSFAGSTSRFRGRVKLKLAAADEAAYQASIDTGQIALNEIEGAFGSCVRTTQEFLPGAFRNGWSRTDLTGKSYDDGDWQVVFAGLFGESRIPAAGQILYTAVIHDKPFINIQGNRVEVRADSEITILSVLN